MTRKDSRSRSSPRRAPAGRVTASRLLLSLLALASAPAVAAAAAAAAAAAVLPAPAPAAFRPLPPQDQFVLDPPDFGPGPFIPPSQPDRIAPDAERTFTLRQIYHHGVYLHPRLHRRREIGTADTKVFLPASDGYGRLDLPPLKVRSRAEKIERLVDRRPSVVDPLVAASRRQGYVSVLSPAAWSVDDVTAPDVTDKETVVSLAYISADAYVEREGDGEWEEVGGSYNRSADFGWEADGLRGHIWADDLNSTVVIGLKGTSPAVFDGDGTTTNDKINDNLFFSCCCAQQGQWSWHKVCDCATGTYQCNNTCVVRHLYEEHRYYAAAKELYSNVTELFPRAEIWLTGHSLGGAIASLLGLTYGLPVVTFEAVPEALPANRLGLPVPPNADPRLPQTRRYTGSWHFGHTADPIYIGTCNGATATCSYAGYAMESACHTGMECVYDVVIDKGWRVGIGTHKIRSVIHDVILKYDDVPECAYTPECRDCANWKMYESNGTDTTTTTTTTTTTPVVTSTSKTRTRTATCQTPGWWGCLDPTTTATATATTDTSLSSTTSTSSCQTPGWFGCKDRTTTDGTTTTPSPPTTATTSPPTTTTRTTTCETPGRFWGCNDETTTADAVTNTPPPGETPPITPAPTGVPTDVPSPAPSPPTRRCARRTWFGKCTKWSSNGDGSSREPEREPEREVMF